jgi:hypothetical protein
MNKHKKVRQHFITQLCLCQCTSGACHHCCPLHQAAPAQQPCMGKQPKQAQAAHVTLEQPAVPVFTYVSSFTSLVTPAQLRPCNT